MLNEHGRLRGERGIVGVNLALTIAFALFAVIELSRVTLAAKQIDDRVKVIVTEVGPGSNVSRLDETQKLNETGRMAEDILTAAKPLSGQADTILQTAKSIDGTVSKILQNASEINGTVKGIQGTANALLPVVRNIHGDDSLNARTGGVAAINKRVATAQTVVPGIQQDLSRANILGVIGTVDAHANAICNSTALKLGGASCAGPVAPAGP